MTDFATQQTTSPQNEKKRNIKKTLGIGILEIGLIVFLLVIIFGLLNFLNILPLSRLPFFSNLPQIPTISRLFQKSPDQQLKDYISTTISFQYQPADYIIQKGKTPQNITYNKTWTTNNISFVAIYQVDAKSDQPILEHVIIPIVTNPLPLDKNSSAKYMLQYFANINPNPSQILCDNKSFPGKTICQFQKTQSSVDQFYQVQAVGKSYKLFASSCIQFQKHAALVDCL